MGVSAESAARRRRWGESEILCRLSSSLQVSLPGARWCF